VRGPARSIGAEQGAWLGAVGRVVFERFPGFGGEANELIDVRGGNFKATKDVDARGLLALRGERPGRWGADEIIERLDLGERRPATRAAAGGAEEDLVGAEAEESCKCPPRERARGQTGR
jgi:hypothetical protein